MKVRVTFKMPDVMEQAYEGLTQQEVNTVRRVAEKFIEYGEYVTVEFDTDKGTARVVPL